MFYFVLYNVLSFIMVIKTKLQIKTTNEVSTDFTGV